jgi:hypothetical protein
MDRFDEYGDVKLGDERLSKRLSKILNQLSGDPSASISGACRDPHQSKAVYRFVGNDEVTTEEITSITRDITVKNVAEAGPDVLLVVQDTTSFDYYNLRATTGLGTLGCSKKAKGFYTHTAIAVGETGEVYGALNQKLWVRPPEKADHKIQRREIEIEDKESYRWLEAMQNAHAALPKDIYAVHVCDREGDILEFFCKADELGANYLVRNQYDRMIIDENGNKRLSDYISNTPVSGEITVHVQRDSHEKTRRECREAVLEIKLGRCTARRPRNLEKNEKIPKSIEIFFVSAEEKGVPEGQTGISWQLITNIPTEDFEAAVTRIKWYTQRWKIETFHRTLKSGCKVEEIQSDTAEKLMKLITIYTIIAMRIMYLCYVARMCPETSCEICLAEQEWKILYRVVNKTKELPGKAPTIEEAVKMIAKYGGFLGRKSDGQPGVTVIWRGLTKLYAVVDAAEYLT